MTSATSLARKIVNSLQGLGVKDVVLSPGSRNAPLSIALYEASQSGRLTLHVSIDERSSAFFALGIAKASQRVVPVVCTSGTALANYHPAVLEAHHSAVPLLILSADRPARLRKTGSNQTTDQVGIFGSAVAFAADVADLDFDLTSHKELIQSGPTHVNLQFDEPLLENSDSKWLSTPQASESAVTQNTLETIAIQSERAVIIVGHDRAGFSVSQIEEFIDQTELPFIAEDPLSFPKALAHASLFLASEKSREKLRCNQIIVIGRTTLSRSINALIAESGYLTVIDPRTKSIDTLRTADEIFTSIPKVTNFKVDTEWRSQWNEISERSKEVIAAIDSWHEGTIAREIAAEISEGALYVSSSRPIRDLEAFAQPRSGVTTYANRGLAGIDGNISTAAGIAHVNGSANAIIGDLAFLHDMPGLLTARKEKLRLIIIDNNGGGIFSTLPQADVVGFEEIFGTPQNVSLSGIAKNFSNSVVEVSSFAELKSELSKPIHEFSVVVVKAPARKDSALFLKETVSRLSSL